MGSLEKTYFSTWTPVLRHVQLILALAVVDCGGFNFPLRNSSSKRYYSLKNYWN
jgi:hypothetical protein